MNEETIVAVFDTADHASAAVRDLERAGVPSGSITQHAGSGGSSQSSTATKPGREQGFWASLFGAEPEYGHDTAVYDRSLESGSTIVTIRTSEQHVSKVLDILERHQPIDIDERAEGYGLAQTRSAGLPTAGATSYAASNTTSREPGTLSLSEETLAVGKRAINRGTTRVRRYVVETPVEEQVNLRDEKVTIERRPVTGDRAATHADFADKTIEVTEMAEEAVVSKQASIREEVVIHKEATDRTETVRDTLRREDVEITKEPGSSTLQHATATPGVATGNPAKPNNSNI